MKQKFVLLLVTILNTLLCVLCEDGKVSLDEFDDFFNTDEFGYRSHRDIKIKHLFLNRDSFSINEASFSTPQLSPSKLVYSIPFNEETIVLITIRNVGRHTFNITHLAGYLHAAHSFDFYAENYTERVMNVPLLPNSEITLEYRFLPWDGLATVDYVFSADVGYILPLTSNIDRIDDNLNDFLIFQEKFANVTITVYDDSKFIDFELLFMWFLIIIFWGSVFIAFWELYYVPDQTGKGNTVMTTLEFFNIHVLPFLLSLIGKQSSNESSDSKSSNKDPNKKKNTKTNQDGWLSGTAMGSKKNKKKKKKN